MYQLNKDYTWHNATIINPQWKLAPILDIGEEMKCVVAVLFYSDAIEGARVELGYFDYRIAETWEDYNLLDYILSLPDFADSTEIIG